MYTLFQRRNEGLDVEYAVFYNCSNEKQLIFVMEKMRVFKKCVVKGRENLAKKPVKNSVSGALLTVAV